MLIEVLFSPSMISASRVTGGWSRERCWRRDIHNGAPECVQQPQWPAG